MDLPFLVTQSLSGLASASSLFVISCGLTLVFGVTRIVNFAHGSFYMLGAYLAVSIVPRLLDLHYSLPMFLVAIVAAAVVVGLVGVVMEVVLLRRIYQAPELFQLLATFGVVLVIEDLVATFWGPLDLMGARAPGMRGAIDILGNRFPVYQLFLIGIGVLVLALLWLLMHRTRYGVLVRAATQDREMVGALGVNQAILFTGTLFLGSFLAGLGGALQSPLIAANAHMDIAIIAEAFVVTVIGGMGSVPGAFIAALLIGQLQAFGILIVPKATLVLVFALMAAVLIVKPWGLLGRPEAPATRAVPEGIVNLKPFGTFERIAAALALAAAVLLPLIGDAYTIKLGTEILIFALAAFSLNLLLGNCGIVSFGHAAYFGIGAYAAGLLATKLGMAMLPALALAPLVTGLFATLFGLFIVRLSGIYLAMLTLAFAQIAYAVAFQWVELTGGDNGIVGVWPASWASGRTTYYYLVLVLTVAAIAMLRHTIYAPFGYTLRAARDSAVRADAIGIDVKRYRLAAFSLAGAAAGLAGALHAFANGSIDPTLMAIPLSIDLLAMTLAGGIQTVIGPLVGAAAFHTAKDVFMPLTDYWRLLLGLAIIAMVLVAPQGLAGGWSRLRARLGGASA